MARRGNRTATLALGVCVAAGAACGDKAAKNSPGLTTEDGGPAFMFSADASLSPDALVGCAADTEQAKQLPLDLYFMIDTSGSMEDLVAQQRSKWSAISAAIDDFVSDPASAGIGVGLQYFPLVKSGVPASCTSSAACGTSGPCLLSACDLTNGSITSVIACNSNADCPAGVACKPVGTCQYDANYLCPTPGTSCKQDDSGFDLGTCLEQMASTCVNGDSCVSAQYASPAVAIAPLPGNASALAASLASHTPDGNTPTVAALAGAIDLVQAFATANPTHASVAVLATDGIPDECTSQTTMTGAVTEVAGVAASGLAGSPSVKTFAIGVFAPVDVASGTAAIDQIAAAGGTSQGFVVNTSGGNVEAAFVSALNSIRTASLPCAYEIPLPESGVPDYTRVNVEYISGAGATTTLPYVASASRCPADGGWYYDQDPTSGATPSSIQVCPTTCSTVAGDPNGRVEVVIGCVTIAR